MKTSLSEIIDAEKYLHGELTPEESVVFQARLLVDEELRRNTFYHKMVNRLVRLYHRRKLKAEVEGVSDKLFRDNRKVDFRDSIIRIFNV
jgi:hypothetical protein